jgi:outer membrane protein insertion porin family
MLKSFVIFSEQKNSLKRNTKRQGKLIEKYNEKGYRDAIIVDDTVYQVEVGRKDKPRVNVELWVDEGDKYYFGDVKWVGNTVYPSDYLNNYLRN